MEKASMKERAGPFCAYDNKIKSKERSE